MFVLCNIYEYSRPHSAAKIAIVRRSSCKWAATFGRFSVIFIQIDEVPQLHITKIMGSSESYSPIQLARFLGWNAIRNLRN